MTDTPPMWPVCQDTHRFAVRGSCPIHGGDGCLVGYTPAEVVAILAERYRLDVPITDRGDVVRRDIQVALELVAAVL